MQINESSLSRFSRVFYNVWRKQKAFGTLFPLWLSVNLLVLFLLVKDPSLSRSLVYGIRYLFFSKSGAIAVATAALLVSFTTLSFRYLDSSSKRISSTERVRIERLMMRDLATEIRSEKQGKGIGYSEFKLRLLADTEFHADLARESVFNEVIVSESKKQIAESFSNDLKKLTTLDLIDPIFAGVETRLKREIQDLSRRGTYNLIIGGSVTFGALTVLLLTAIYLPGSHSDWHEAMLYFVPRVSTTVFAEVFAFFFLNLYKDSLAEIKNYQNQLTGIARLSIGIRASFTFGTDSSRNAVLNALCEKDASPLASINDRTGDEVTKQIAEILLSLAKGLSDKK